MRVSITDGIMNCGGRAKQRRRFRESLPDCDSASSASAAGSKAVSPLRSATAVRNASSAGFTLIELIVVISIIAALVVVGLPAIKGITQSHTVSSASQQLMDDLGLARQYAMNNRSVVHVLFLPSDITNWTYTASIDLARRLMAGVYTTYAIYAERTVGDQPGQPHPRYLTKWKALPDGVFIPPREMAWMRFKDWDAQNNPLGRPLLWDTGADFPFPTLANQTPRRKLPHIAFGPHGGLLIENSIGQRQPSRDEVIELARGSVLAVRDESNGSLLYFDARESPPNNSIDNYNRIRIDGLTGRCSLERPELP